MPKTVILHITGEDMIVAEIDREPEPTDVFVRVSNLRRRDGKDVGFLAPGVQTVLYPWHRINFLEIIVSEEERGQVIDFFRDS